MLTFDEPSHTYYWHGKRVPHVTGILERACSLRFVDPDVLAIAQDRGTYVHKMCELDDLDDLDPTEEDGAYAGYLRAWRAFCSDYGANWEGIEEQGYSQQFGVAGTLDRRGTLERRFGKVPFIIDIKSGPKHKIIGVQTAAYRQIVAEKNAKWALARRASVHVQADGRYQFAPWNNPLDFSAFQSLVTLQHWNDHAK